MIDKSLHLLLGVLCTGSRLRQLRRKAHRLCLCSRRPFRRLRRRTLGGSRALALTCISESD